MSVATNLHYFQSDLRAFAEAVDADLQAVVRKVAFDIFGAIVKRTPVDTGHARAGWAVTINEPNLTQPPEGQKGTVLPEPVPDLSAVTPHDIIFITNPVVYIEPLENGHSAQAPFGMVRIALALAQGEIDTHIASITQ